MPALVHRAIVVTALCIAAALGGFLAGRSQQADPFANYREIRAHVVAHQRQQEAVGAVWLLGSSTLERLNSGRLGAPVTNLAIGGDTITDVSQRLPSARQLAQSAGVLVLVGFNDLQQGRSPDEAVDLYENLLGALQAAPVAICVTLQPLAPSSTPDRNRLSADLRAFNDGIRRLCSASAKRQLVDLEQLLMAAAPGDSSRLYVDDVHLSNIGYDVLAEALRAAVLARAGPAS